MFIRKSPIFIGYAYFITKMENCQPTLKTGKIFRKKVLTKRKQRDIMRMSPKNKQTRKEKYMPNTAKLRGKIAEAGFSLSSLSRECGISRPSLRAKITGRTDFRSSEIERLAGILGIEQSEILVYFFAPAVPKK